jgi:hypothetical protein
VEPHKLKFPNEDFGGIGHISPPKKVKLHNSKHRTSQPVTLEGIAITGDFAKDPGTTSCGSSLAPGASCIYGLTFTPTARGMRTGTLTIEDNAHNAQQMVKLVGHGVAPPIAIAPQTLAFGKVTTGMPSGPKGLTLTNHSPVPIALGTITAATIAPNSADDFAITGNNCGSQLAPNGGTCQVMVTFTPGAQGAASGLLTIPDDALHNPKKVKLSGSGK